jgi:hypothetical protein
MARRLPIEAKAPQQIELNPNWDRSGWLFKADVTELRVSP